MIQNFIYFAISGLFLVLSGIYLVKSLEKIARFLHISEFSAAFIIMAIATSIPELFVGVSSALQGNPALSLGNIIGANIIDLTLITGIFIVMARGIKLKSEKVGKGVYFMFLSIVLVIVLYLIGNSLSRVDGVILLVLFGINSYRVLRKSEKYTAKFNKVKEKTSKKVKSILIFLISLMVLFISSNYVVKYSHLIALNLNVPEIIVGLFLLSIATTLPELVFGINAVILKHPEMSIGDQTGTVFTNICLVLGIVAIIHPITVAFTPFLISAVFLFLSALIFLAFIKSGKKLDIFEGISLIVFYLIFVIIQFFIR